MSELKVNKISPETATSLTVGTSGDTVTVPSGATLDVSNATVNLPTTLTVATELKTNKISPASGTTMTMGDSGDAFTVPSGVTFANSGTATGFGGALTLISTQTPSGVTTVEFTSGIDSTYDVYIFKFIDIHCVVNNGRLYFNGSTDGGSTFATTKTTSMFTAQHNENNAIAGMDYEAGFDLDQSTADQTFMSNMTSEADGAMAGEFHLFAPSSTTYVKHFNSNVQWLARPSSTIRGSANTRVGGYFNTTSAVDAINFTMSSGNFSGTIQLWGL